MTVIAVTSPLTVCPPPDPVTVIVPTAGVTLPPGTVAVIVAVPAATAVARPSAFTVAMAGALELQVTDEVTSSEVGEDGSHEGRFHSP